MKEIVCCGPLVIVIVIAYTNITEFLSVISTVSFFSPVDLWRYVECVSCAVPKSFHVGRDKGLLCETTYRMPGKEWVRHVTNRVFCHCVEDCMLVLPGVVLLDTRTSHHNSCFKGVLGGSIFCVDFWVIKNKPQLRSLWLFRFTLARIKFLYTRYTKLTPAKPFFDVHVLLFRFKNNFFERILLQTDRSMVFISSACFFEDYVNIITLDICLFVCLFSVLCSKTVQYNCKTIYSAQLSVPQIPWNVLDQYFTK